MTIQPDLFDAPVHPPRPQGVHEHSRKAYHEELATMPTRAGHIYRALRDRGPMTDREVMAYLYLPDMNSVRPRITEGIDAGIFHEVGERECPVTHKTVRVVDIVREEP